MDILQTISRIALQGWNPVIGETLEKVH